MRCVRAMIGSIRWGPTPVLEGLEQLDDIQNEIRGNPRLQSWLHVVRGGLHALQGRFDEGRDLINRGIRIEEDLGLQLSIANDLSQGLAYLELLAGDPAAAERALRIGYDILDGMGETFFLSTTAAILARAVHAQGRDDEAIHFTGISEQTAAPDDVASQVIWRGARARVLAGRGEADPAEELAREAAALAEPTDLLEMRGDSLMDLAVVLRSIGRSDEDKAARHEAASLYEAKGATVLEAKARALLDAPEGGGPN
jgi:ATP/maltotriose-dependent transcriptional regulator MalT